MLYIIICICNFIWLSRINLTPFPEKYFIVEPVSAARPSSKTKKKMRGCHISKEKKNKYMYICIVDIVKCS